MPYTRNETIDYLKKIEAFLQTHAKTAEEKELLHMLVRREIEQEECGRLALRNRADEGTIYILRKIDVAVHRLWTHPHNERRIVPAKRTAVFSVLRLGLSKFYAGLFLVLVGHTLCVSVRAVRKHLVEPFH